jgi:uncharacterized protein (UPF0332 family)
LAILNPDHLLEQAERLIAAPSAGPPRQVDLRRALSAAYYAVFHCVATAAADEIVGKTQRNTTSYGLVYRSLDHRTLREFCLEIAKPTPSARFRRYAPANGFGVGLEAFANLVPELQEKRHTADYDPTVRIKTSDVRLVIDEARSAIRRLSRVGSVRRKTFILILLFTPRQR